MLTAEWWGRLRNGPDTLAGVNQSTRTSKHPCAGMTDNLTVLNRSRFVKSFFRKPFRNPFRFIILRLMEICRRAGNELFRKMQTTENKRHKNRMNLLK
jgi:hypothetical protein